MFGQPSSNSPFASPTPGAAGSTPFGQSNSAFGTPSPAPFGSSAPGATSTGFGGFGTPAPAPAFGSPAPAPGFGASGTTGFGGFGTPAPGFGATSSTTPFGSTSTGTSLFGAPAPAPSSSLFGAPAPAPSTGLFGSSASTGFGNTAPSTSFGFGSTAPAPAPSTGLFGAPAPAAPPSFGGFGGTMSQPGAFGAPAPSTGLFGSTAPAAQRPGTLAVPYQVTNRSDGNSNMAIQAITAMPQYENKSFEELRLEDYTSGNKGSQTGAPAGGGGGFAGFGASSAAPAPASGGGGFGLFGSSGGAAGGGGFGAAGGGAAPTPAFGAGGFGGAAGGASGAGAFSFGAQTAGSGGTGFGFGASGAKPQNTSLFGSAPAPASGSLFGAPAPAPAGGGLFGSAPAPASGSLFGSTAPAPASGGLFGQPAPAPATGSLFGSPASAPAPGSLFGAPAPAPSTSLFGSTAPAPATGGLFGSTAPAPATGSLFGSTNRSPASGGLFGSSAPATGGFFGSTAPAPATGGLFGSTAPASGGLFGHHAPAPTAGGLFGSTRTHAVPSAIPAAPPSTEALLAQQLAAIEAQRKELALLEPWRGNPPDGSKVVPSSLSERDAAAYSSGKDTSKDMVVSTYAASSQMSSQSMPKSAARIRPRGIGKISSKIALGEKTGSPLLSPDSYLGSSAKRLVIQPGALKPKMRLLLTNGDLEQTPEAQIDADLQTRPENESPATENGTPASDFRNRSHDREQTPPAVATTLVYTGDSPTPEPPRQPDSTTPQKSTFDEDYAYQYYREVVGSPERRQSPQKQNGDWKSSCVPRLTKSGYRISPPLVELRQMSEADLAAVSDFSVSRDGYGSISWDGAVDVRNVDLDSVVQIKSKEIFVYDEQETSGKKPPIGSKLNRSAVIVLEQIFPKKKEDEEAKAKFIKKIEKTTSKMGAELIEYDAEKGIWKFRVQHFSRYGLEDDEEEDEDMDRNDQNKDILALVPGGGLVTPTIEYDHQPYQQSYTINETNTTPTSPTKGLSHLIAPLDDEDTIEPTEDMKMSDETQILQDAEEAYRTMMMQTAMQLGYTETDRFNVTRSHSFSEEGETLLALEASKDTENKAHGGVGSEYAIPEPVLPQADDTTFRKTVGICTQLARASGIQLRSSSACDFGMRMGRSFRVGWSPDGSIIHHGCLSANDKSRRGGLLIRQRIAYREGAMGTPTDDMPLSEIRTKLLPALETHLKYSVKLHSAEEDGCSRFYLPKGPGAKNQSTDSYKALCSAIDAYATAAERITSTHDGVDPELGLVPARAFRLLSILYGQETNAFETLDDNTLKSPLLPVENSIPIDSLGKQMDTDSDVRHKSSSSNRRMQGLSSWLRESLHYDTQSDIQSAEERNDVYSAIFAALSGGDVSRACALAMDHGHFRLATLLSNEACKEDLRAQMQLWHDVGAADFIDSGLNRVYALMGGDLELEESLYRHGGIRSLDWRRRLGMKLWCGSKKKTNNIAALMDSYDADVEAGVAPPPYPRYGEGPPSVHCLLYRLLRMRAGGGSQNGASLSGIVSPDGHTPSVHDYSMAFHLAAVIRALGCAPPLTRVEEDRLVDSYVAQLISAGMWEWAVYITLCTDAEEPTNATQTTKHAFRKAKELVMRYYDSESASKRTFLEHLGIPNAWFEEALAARSAYRGKTQEYVNHLIAGSKFEDAVAAVEKLLMPKSLMMGGETALKFRDFLEFLMTQGVNEVPQWNEVNGCGAILDFLNFSEDVMRVSKMSLNERESNADLIRRLIDISEVLQSKITVPLKETLEIRQFPEPDSFSNIFLTEATESLSFLRLQLMAIQSGISTTSEEVNLGDIEGKPATETSQLAYVITEEECGDLSSEFERVHQVKSALAGVWGNHIFS